MGFHVVIYLLGSHLYSCSYTGVREECLYKLKVSQPTQSPQSKREKEKSRGGAFREYITLWVPSLFFRKIH